MVAGVGGVDGEDRNVGEVFAFQSSPGRGGGPLAGGEWWRGLFARTAK
jgi:hypothetical protein